MTGLNVNQMIWVTLQLELFISSAGRKNTNSPLMGLCFINCYAKLCWTAFAGCWGHSRLAGALEETLKWIRKCRLSDVGGYDHSVVVRTKSYENDSVTVFSLLPFKSVTFNFVYLKLKQSPGVLHIRKKLFPLSKHLQAGRIKKSLPFKRKKPRTEPDSKWAIAAFHLDHLRKGEKWKKVSMCKREILSKLVEPVTAYQECCSRVRDASRALPICWIVYFTLHKIQSEDLTLICWMTLQSGNILCGKK